MESQLSCIIVQIIDEDPTCENAESLQQNLSDLCRMFLETGDYCSLAKIFLRLSAKCQGEHAEPLPVHEAVFSLFLEPEFHEEILNGLIIWGKPKYEEIKGIILGIGAPFVEPLIQRLSDEPSISLRHYYLDCLQKLGNAAKEGAIEHLQDSRWYVVRNMIVLLRGFGDPSVLRFLRPVADHRHPRVRHELIRTLYALRRSEADQLLVREFSSSDHEVVLNAIQMAEQSRDAGVLECLRSILSLKLLAKAEYELKCAAIKTLGKIGNPKILPDFIRILTQKTLFTSSLLDKHKADIVRSLEEYPFQVVAPLLQKISQFGTADLAPLASEVYKKMEMSNLHGR
jgi:hypothetical protein